MSIQSIFDHPCWLVLARTLGHSLWQGVVIVMLIWLVRGLLRRDQDRYLVSVAAMFLCLIAPLVTFGLLYASPIPSAATQPVSSAPAVSIVPADWTLSGANWTVVAWLCGVVCFGMRLAGGIGATRQLLSGGGPVSESVATVALSISRKMGLARCPEVLVSPRVSQAVVLRFFKPVVLLPASWVGQVPPDVLEVVLAHEFAHIRRGDMWIILCQRFVEMVLFYHPAVWLLIRWIRLDRELCCDSVAARLLGEPLTVARALEWVAHRGMGVQGLLFSSNIGGSQMTLLHRIRHLLGVETRRRSYNGLQAVMGVVGLLGVCVWAGLVGSDGVLAQERNRESEVREGAREQRDGDRDRARESDRERGERDRERARESDRERGERDRERARESDRERGARDRDRPRGDRDGDRRRGDREVGERDRGRGDDRARFDDGREGPPRGRRRAGPETRPRDFDGPRPTGRTGARGGREMHPEIRELAALVRALRNDVEALRHEIRELRGQRGAGRESGRVREREVEEIERLRQPLLRRSSDRDELNSERIRRGAGDRVIRYRVVDEGERPDREHRIERRELNVERSEERRERDQRDGLNRRSPEEDEAVEKRRAREQDEAAEDRARADEAEAEESEDPPEKDDPEER